MLQKLMLTSTDSEPRPPLQHHPPHSDTDCHHHQAEKVARRLNDQRRRRPTTFEAPFPRSCTRCSSPATPM
ncbi:hypothetical protein BGY98DRAFT_1012811 [Russula aff. rugulosa BPL654]|nr:hypothetical protein BGY98DRAFT_1012811 [Russula aff. rugulosa BPL654]